MNEGRLHDYLGEAATKPMEGHAKVPWRSMRGTVQALPALLEQLAAISASEGSAASPDSSSG